MSSGSAHWWGLGGRRIGDRRRGTHYRHRRSRIRSQLSLQDTHVQSLGRLSTNLRRKNVVNTCFIGSNSGQARMPTTRRLSTPCKLSQVVTLMQRFLSALSRFL